MAQDIIIKGKDNPIVINFTFNVPADLTFGLNGFDDIVVIFGIESYSLLLQPLIVVVNSDTQLQLNLGNTAEAYPAYFEIIGINGTYPNGYELTSKCLQNLSIPSMC